MAEGGIVWVMPERKIIKARLCLAVFNFNNLNMRKPATWLSVVQWASQN